MDKHTESLDSLKWAVAETLGDVADGMIARCGDSEKEIVEALLGGTVMLGIVTRSKDDGLELMAISHLRRNGSTIRLRFSCGFPYDFGDPVMYTMTRDPDGSVMKSIVCGKDYLHNLAPLRPLFLRLKALTAIHLQQGSDLRDLIINASFLKVDGWKAVAEAELASRTRKAASLAVLTPTEKGQR